MAFYDDEYDGYEDMVEVENLSYDDWANDPDDREDYSELWDDVDDESLDDGW